MKPWDGSNKACHMYRQIMPWCIQYNTYKVYYKLRTKSTALQSNLQLQVKLLLVPPLAAWASSHFWGFQGKQRQEAQTKVRKKINKIPIFLSRLQLSGRRLKMLSLFTVHTAQVQLGAKGGSTGQAHDHDNFHDNNSSRIVCSCGCCCHQLTQSLSTLWHVCHTHPVQSNETKDWNRGWWTHTYPALILHSFCSHPALILQCAGNAQLWDDRMSVCDTLTTLSDVLLKQK